MHFRAPECPHFVPCQEEILANSFQPADFITHKVHHQVRGWPLKLDILKVGDDEPNPALATVWNLRSEIQPNLTILFSDFYREI
jgi:hypothetical protein